MRHVLTWLILASLALGSLGCPPEKAEQKDDDHDHPGHKHGDGKDHEKERPPAKK